MQLSTALQILNVLFLALFGTAGWRMLNEWRKSREERHRAELAVREQRIESHKAEIESLKTTHRHELEKFALQIARLVDENKNLSQNRDDRTVLFEQQIAYLKTQAPAGVSANFDSLKKWNAEQLAVHEKKLRECQSALSKEQSEHQAARKSKDALIEHLHADLSTFTASGSGIGLQSILWPPDRFQLLRLERGRENVRGLVADAGVSSVPGLIQALGHWDGHVREIAAKELASRGETVVAALIARLRRVDLADRLLGLVVSLAGGPLQQIATIIHVLTAIGDPAVPRLKELLLDDRNGPRVRAIIALRCINTKQANEVLEHDRPIVDKWRGAA